MGTNGRYETAGLLTQESLPRSFRTGCRCRAAHALVTWTGATTERATVKAAVVRSFDRPLEDVNHAVDQVLDEARPSHGWCSR